MNKEAAADVLSLLLQTGFSGRAELGLIGDDDFVLKVSPDGAAWTEAIRVDKTTARATLGGALETTGIGIGVAPSGVLNVYSASPMTPTFNGDANVDPRI
jgi:hypothetical protein